MIEVSGLVKTFGSFRALDGVSFTVGEREILGFLGPNGAGKSTTMNIMTGYLSSNEGSVKIDGIDMAEQPDKAKKLIGFLPEQPPLYMDMKVDEYLRFVYELKGCTLARDAHLEEICRVCRLTEVRGRLIKNLSKGYRQRVGIAQALVGYPKVLIFDEPTVGLDPKQIIEVRNLIRTLGRTHTVILSTHILSEAQSVCDRVVIINGGKVLADEKTDNIAHALNRSTRYAVKICGSSQDVVKALRGVPGVTSAEPTGERERDSITYRVECENGFDTRKNLFFAMAEKGCAVVGLEEEGMSLEDVFIKLTDTNPSAGTRKGGGAK